MRCSPNIVDETKETVERFLWAELYKARPNPPSKGQFGSISNQKYVNIQLDVVTHICDRYSKLSTRNDAVLIFRVLRLFTNMLKYIEEFAEDVSD